MNVIWWFTTKHTQAINDLFFVRSFLCKKCFVLKFSVDVIFHSLVAINWVQCRVTFVRLALSVRLDIKFKHSIMKQKFAIKSPDEQALNTPNDTLCASVCGCFSTFCYTRCLFRFTNHALCLRVYANIHVDRISWAFWTFYVCVCVFVNWLCLSRCHMNPNSFVCVFILSTAQKTTSRATKN